MKQWDVLQGETIQQLRGIPSESIDTCITLSVPLPCEVSMIHFVSNLVWIFQEVRRVLKNAGTMWLKLDSRDQNTIYFPWLLAMALRNDGWYLRSDIIWHTKSPVSAPHNMLAKEHEYVFLLSKSRSYYYDAAAIKEPLSPSSLKRINQATFETQRGGEKDYKYGTNPNRSARRTLENFKNNNSGGRNKRTVWPEASVHELLTTCILAGTSEEGVVLDPFCSVGTVGVQTISHNRRFIGIETSPNLASIARQRLILSPNFNGLPYSG